MGTNIILFFKLYWNQVLLYHNFNNVLFFQSDFLPHLLSTIIPVPTNVFYPPSLDSYTYHDTLHSLLLLILIRNVHGQGVNPYQSRM